MLFVSSLVFVTLMQIAVIHSSSSSNRSSSSSKVFSSSNVVYSSSGKSSSPLVFEPSLSSSSQVVGSYDAFRFNSSSAALNFLDAKKSMMTSETTLVTQHPPVRMILNQKQSSSSQSSSREEMIRSALNYSNAGSQKSTMEGIKSSPEMLKSISPSPTLESSRKFSPVSPLSSTSPPSASSSPNSKVSTPTTTATGKKKSKEDILRIEALVDRSLPSRELNVKILQNYVNSARIKEIITSLQDRGMLDSPLPRSRQETTKSHYHDNEVEEVEDDKDVQNNFLHHRGEELEKFSNHQSSLSSVATPNTNNGAEKDVVDASKPDGDNIRVSSRYNSLPNKPSDRESNTNTNRGYQAKQAGETNFDVEDEYFPQLHANQQEGGMRIRDYIPSNHVVEGGRESLQGSSSPSNFSPSRSSDGHKLKGHPSTTALPSQVNHLTSHEGRQDGQPQQQQQLIPQENEEFGREKESPNQTSIHRGQTFLSSSSSALDETSKRINLQSTVTSSPSLMEDNFPSLRKGKSSGGNDESGARTKVLASGKELRDDNQGESMMAQQGRGREVNQLPFIISDDEQQKQHPLTSSLTRDSNEVRKLTLTTGKKTRTMGRENVTLIGPSSSSDKEQETHFQDRKEERKAENGVMAKDTSQMLNHVVDLSSKSKSTYPSSSSVMQNTTLLLPPSVLQKALSSNKTLCPLTPPKLIGRIAIELEPDVGPDMENVAKGNPLVSPGGSFSPRECFSRHRVAIIIPYRDRRRHLEILLFHLHPILQRQQLEYTVFVVEQAGNDTFNKGVLMNAGVREALKEKDFHCFIFHDVDLIPEDDRNLYSCPTNPRHMSYAVDKFNYT